MAAMAGVFDSRRWGPGDVANDLPAITGRLTYEVVRTCEREGVEPVGALTVEPISDVFDERDYDYAWRWKLELA